jgi:hypothetical protein
MRRLLQVSVGPADCVKSYMGLQAAGTKLVLGNQQAAAFVGVEPFNDSLPRFPGEKAYASTWRAQ